MSLWSLCITLGLMSIVGAQISMFQGDKPDYRSINASIVFGALLLMVGVLMYQWVGLMAAAAFLLELVK